MTDAKNTSTRPARETRDARDTWLVSAMQEAPETLCIKATATEYTPVVWFYAVDGDEIVAERATTGVRKTGRLAAEQLHRAVQGDEWGIEAVNRSETPFGDSDE